MSTEKYHLIELEYDNDDLLHTEFDTEEEAIAAMKDSDYKCYIFKGQLIDFEVQGRNMKTYLCGSMSGLKDQGAGWRKKIRKWLDKHNIKAYDPCKEESEEHDQHDITNKSDWESFPQSLQEKIIIKDLAQIHYCSDFVICYFTKYSTGTVSELTFAYYHDIPVYMVTDIPLVGWPLTIARAESNRVFNNFKDLKKFIKETYVKQTRN